MAEERRRRLFAAKTGFSIAAGLGFFLLALYFPLTGGGGSTFIPFALFVAIGTVLLAGAITGLVTLSLEIARR